MRSLRVSLTLLSLLSLTASACSPAMEWELIHGQRKAKTEEEQKNRYYATRGETADQGSGNTASIVGPGGHTVTRVSVGGAYLRRVGAGGSSSKYRINAGLHGNFSATR